METPATPSPKKHQPSAELLLIILLVAFAVRVYHLDFQSLWRDEVDAIRFSSGALPQLLRGLTRQGHNGPLYFVALHGWRALTGDSEFALRFLSVVGGTLSVALAWAASNALGLKKRVGLIAAALMATAPYLVWYSQEAKMYSWLMSAVLLAVILFQRALTARTAKGRWWGAFAGVTSLSFYLHILSPLMLGVYGLWTMLAWRRARRQWRQMLAVLAALTLPYLPLLAWQFPLLRDGFRSGHPFYPLKTMLNLLIHFYSVGVLRQSYAIVLMGAMVALVMIGALFADAPVRRRMQLVGWWALPVAAVYLISLRVAVFEDRYLIYIAPAFFFLVALGIDALWQRMHWLGWSLLVAWVAVNGWGIGRQQTITIKADFRQAAAYVAATPAAPVEAAPQASASPVDAPFTVYLPLVLNNPAPVVLFQMPYLHYTFEYYFRAPFNMLEGVWTNSGRTPAEVDADMRRLTAGVGSLYFVVSEEAQWDNRQLVRQWLQEHGTLQDEAHFVGVDVYRYRLVPTE